MLSTPIMHTIDSLEARTLLSFPFAYAAAFGDRETLDSGNAVVMDSAGNTYFGGTFEGKIDVNKSNHGEHFLKTTPDNNDAFLVKYDPNGKLLWAQRYGAERYDSIDHLVIGPNGDLYATGVFERTVDFDPGRGVHNLTSHGRIDAFILHLTPKGHYVWAGNIGGDRDDAITAFAVGTSGDMYYSGYVRLRGDADPTRKTRTIIDRGVDDTIVARLDGRSGAIKWMKVYGEDSTRETVFGLAVDASENVMAAGVFDDTVQFDRRNHTLDRQAVGSDDIYLARFNSRGDFKFIKTIGGTEQETMADMVQDNQGNLYLTGNFAKTVDFDPGNGHDLLAAPGDSSAYVLKMDADANLIWARLIGPAVINGDTQNASITARGIGIDVNGAVYTVGDFAGTVDFDPSAALHLIDVEKSGNTPAISGQFQPSDSYLLKLDSDGNFAQVTHFGGPDGTILSHDIAVNPAGAINVTGAYAGFVDLNPTSGTFRRSTRKERNDTDVFLIKLLP